jgi:hypothetical protein
MCHFQKACLLQEIVTRDEGIRGAVRIEILLCHTVGFVFFYLLASATGYPECSKRLPKWQAFAISSHYLWPVPQFDMNQSPYLKQNVG